jgi:hypothetical protein
MAGYNRDLQTNSVMLVIQTDSAGWRSSHATTGGSGRVRINAESTLVSRTIICRISPIADADRAIPAAPLSARFSRNARNSRPQLEHTSVLFFHRVAQNVPDFVFHAAPVIRGAAFQARFHVVFQMANDKLGHRQPSHADIDDILISYLMAGCKFESVREAVCWFRPIARQNNAKGRRAQSL